MIMMRRYLVCAILAVICVGCTRGIQTDTPVTWRQEEDEIILYIYLSSEASAELINMLDEPVTFEQVSEFLAQNTEDRIPFFEGAMTSAALTARRVELKAEMEKKGSQDGVVMQIIGFKENPVKIIKGALDLSQAPKYLANFDPRKDPEVVNKMIDLMSEQGFVVEVYGRFPDQ